ncbi:hypothetical protein ES702_00129 [subsurface metagenome]
MRTVKGVLGGGLLLEGRVGPSLVEMGERDVQRFSGEWRRWGVI